MHKDVRAILISLGTEITEGIIQDTHGQFLASELTALGIRVERIEVLPDGPEAVQDLKTAIRRCDLLIVSGGLGPTADDISRDAIAEAAGAELRFDEKLWEELEASYGLSKADANRRQSYIPDGFVVIENAQGTAPGFWGEVDGTMVCALPGPPRELRPMFFDTLREEIVSFFDLEPGESTEASTFLIPEAVLEDVCGYISSSLSGEAAKIRWRTRFQPYRISLYLEGADREARNGFVEKLKERFGEDLVRYGDKGAFKLMSEAARERGVRIASAESCTGGLWGKLVTDLPGSSDLFWGSFVTYADDAKISVLGVRPETLETFGAVSQKTVEEMAAGARTRSGSQYAVAISGIAGPSGGTAEKPVGTVCFAVDGDTSGGRSFTFNLGTRRDLIRRRSAVAAALLMEKAILSPESLDSVKLWHYS